MKSASKIFVFILAFFLLYSLVKNVINYQEKIQFYQSFKNDYLKEKKGNTELKTKVLKNKDLSQVEKTIRNKLNLLKPDEIALMLPAPSPTPQIFIPTPIPNWLQWWEVFTKIDR